MNPAVGVLGAALLLVGGAVLAWFGTQATRRAGVRRLEAVLGATEAPSEPGLAAVWSDLVRAAEAKGRGSDLFTRIGRMLERAGWVLRPTEFVAVLAGVAVVGLALGVATIGGIAGGFAGAVLVPAVMVLLLRSRGRRLAHRVDAQLPDALGAMAAAMRAGHSVPQALAAVAERSPSPIGPQFARVLAETRVGRPLDEALDALAERVGSLDLRWTVRAMSIQARTGGRLSDILEVLAEFMRDREEVRREVRALTAEGKLSAAVLLALPFVVGLAIMVLRRSYLTPLFTEPLGLVMLALGSVLMVIAAVVIRKIVRVDV